MKLDLERKEESLPTTEDTNSETHPPGSQRNGKLFLGGLSQDTTAADIQAYFKDFGVVKESFIKMDALTGRSRGFGFVIFVDPCCADAVFKTLPHLIKGKQLDIKAAVPKHLTKDRGLGSRKVFVGGLSQMVTEDFLRFYFNSKFGEVSEVKIMFDHSTPKPHRHRGFAFVTFQSADVADQVCRINYHQIMDKKVEIKLASIAEEPTRGKILPTLPSRKLLASHSSSMASSSTTKTHSVSTIVSTTPTASSTTSVSSTPTSTGKESKKIPPPLVLEEATPATKPAFKEMPPPPIEPIVPLTTLNPQIIYPAPPPPSPMYFAPYSPYPFALPSPLHPLPNSHHYYASAHQNYPLLSPLAFPAYPFPQPLQQQQQPTTERPLSQSPMPSIDGDSIVSSDPPSVFVFPSMPPAPGSDSGRYSPCPGSIASSSDGYCAGNGSVGDASAGPSPVPSPVPDMLQQRGYYPHLYWPSPVHQQMSQDPAECRTPNLPLPSPMMPSYYQSAMTPTSYDSFGFYHTAQSLPPPHPPPPGFDRVAPNPLTITKDVGTEGCCRAAIEDVPCEVHSVDCQPYRTDIYGNYFADAWCESRE